MKVELHRDKKGVLFTKKYNANELLYFEKQLKNWRKEWNLIKEHNLELKDLYLELE